MTAPATAPTQDAPASATPPTQSGDAALGNDPTATPSPQSAPLPTSGQVQPQDPSIQTQQPQVSAQAGQVQNPAAAPASSMPTQAPPLTHTQRLLQTARSITESMTPGGLYKTTIDPNTGETSRVAQPVSARSIGLAIALEALTGGLAGAGAHGPNATGAAAEAGLQQGEKIAQQHQDQQDQLDKQAQIDLNTRFQTVKNNLMLTTQARALSKADEQDHIDAEAQARPNYEAAQKEGAIVADNLEDADALDHKKYPIDQFDRYLVGHHIATDADGNQLYMIPGSGRIVPKDTTGAVPKYVNTWAIADRHKFTMGEDGGNLPYWDSQVARGGILGNQAGTAVGKITSVQAQALQTKDAVTNAAMADINRVRADQGQPALNLDGTMKKNGSLQDALGLFQTQLGVNGHQYTGALQAVQAKYPDSAAIIAQSYGGIKAMQQLDLTTAQHDQDNKFRVNGFKNADEATQVMSNPNASPDVKAQAKEYLDTADQRKAKEEQTAENIKTGGQIAVERAKAKFAANAAGAGGGAVTEAPVNGVRLNYLHSLPNAAQVQQIGEGRQFSTRMFDGKEGKSLAAQVANAYPDYDVSKAASYYKTRNDFDNGKESRQVNALNTAMGHLNTANTALNNVGALGTLPGVSSVERAFGSQDANTLEVARKVMIEEIHSAWSSGAMTVDDRKAWEHEIQTASPRELRQKMRAVTELLGTKLENLQQQFDDSVPSSAVTPKQIMHDSSRAYYKSITGNDAPAILQPRGNQTQGTQSQSNGQNQQPQQQTVPNGMIPARLNGQVVGYKNPTTGQVTRF